jgi:hypothetical protein
MTVSGNGRILMPDGMSYEILVLPPTGLMTLPVLKKLHSMVSAGAIVTGNRPLGTPGLTGYPGSQEEFKELVFDLWGDLDGISRTQRSFGKGKIIWGMPLSNILALKGIPKDLESGVSPEKVSWIHRRTDDEDIYFIVNRTDTIMDLNMKFRSTGREAELWDPSTGKITPSGYSFSEGKTFVALKLGERQSTFVVFRNKTEIRSRTIPYVQPILLSTLTGPWTINFQPGMGAPDKIEAQILESWTVNPEAGIKYFSGTATYKKSITAPKGWFTEGTNLILDLGTVCDLAEVSVNGQPAGVLWNVPFRTNVTGMLKKGTNTIEIKVTNQWTNRLAGDQLADPADKILKSPLRVFGGRNLNDSGLLGPVTILKE